MKFAVVAIVAGGSLVIVWAMLLKRMFGGSGSLDTGPAVPYGGLPDLGPVGPLGVVSPDADLATGTSDPHDLLDP
jgi:hypothetical protein